MPSIDGQCLSVNGQVPIPPLLPANDGHSKNLPARKKNCVLCVGLVCDGQTDDTIQCKGLKVQSNFVQGPREKRK